MRKVVLSAAYAALAAVAFVVLLIGSCVLADTMFPRGVAGTSFRLTGTEDTLRVAAWADSSSVVRLQLSPDEGTTWHTVVVDTISGNTETILSYDMTFPGWLARAYVEPAWESQSSAQVNVFLKAGAERAASPSVTSLVQPNDVQYVGSFRIPTTYPETGGGTPWLGWSRGGEMIAYSTEDDGGADSFPGTLWVSTYHIENQPTNYGGRIGQFSIPTPSTSTEYTDWPTATFLNGPLPQDFGKDHFDAVDNNRPFMSDGLWYDADGDDEGVLMAAVYGYYNESDGDLPHAFYAPDSFDSTSALLHVGPRPADLGDIMDPWTSLKHSGYFFQVPDWWADTWGKGACIAVGQGNREGGHREGPNYCLIQNQYDDSSRVGCHLGPGFALVNPDSFFAAAHFNEEGYEIPAFEAAGYYEYHPVQVTAFDYDFGDKDSWVSMAWISNYPFNSLTKNAPNGQKHAVVVLVQDCEGIVHYRNDSGCFRGDDCCGPTTTTGFVCGDSTTVTTEGRCWSAELWFFDPADYEAVLNGAADPWTPQPYAMLDITPRFNAYLQNLICDGGDFKGLTALSMTYDISRSLLFVAERGRSGCCQRPPFIHVFRIV